MFCLVSDYFLIYMIYRNSYFDYPQTFVNTGFVSSLVSQGFCKSEDCLSYCNTACPNFEICLYFPSRPGRQLIFAFLLSCQFLFVYYLSVRVKVSIVLNLPNFSRNLFTLPSISFTFLLLCSVYEYLT